MAVGRGGVNEGGDEGMETREKGDVDEWIQMYQGNGCKLLWNPVSA